MSNTLLLADLKECEDPIGYIAGEFEVPREELGISELLIGYINVGSWGCDSSAWILFRDAAGQLKEVHGSHCSCYGFEGQWEPKDSSAVYLKSPQFRFYTGGYDDSKDENEVAVNAYIAAMEMT